MFITKFDTTAIGLWFFYFLLLIPQEKKEKRTYPWLNLSCWTTTVDDFSFPKSADDDLLMFWSLSRMSVPSCNPTKQILYRSNWSDRSRVPPRVNFVLASSLWRFSFLLSPFFQYQNLIASTLVVVSNPNSWSPLIICLSSFLNSWILTF